jgi:PGF-pre-PGF domain-containing protein
MREYFFLIALVIFLLLPNLTSSQPYLTENVSWEMMLEPVQWGQLVAGDINNDNLTDIVIMGCNGGTGGNCNSYVTRIYVNNDTKLVENSTWNQNITQVHSGSVVLGDIDNDGDLDLISSGCNNGGGQATECGTGGFQTKVYVNNGTTLVENSTWKGNVMNVWYGSMSIGDINNDGNLDLILSGENESLSKITKVYINNGTKFIENSTWEQNLLSVDESSLVLGDFNNDGYLDLSLTGCCDKHRIYINNKTTFLEIQRDNQDLVGVFQSSQSFGDYDNDGDLDLITIGREGYTTLYLFNQSSMNFSSYPNDPEPQIMDLEYTPSIIWTDLERDADLDLIEVGWGGGSGGWFQAKVYTNNISINNNIPISPNNFSNNFSNGLLTLAWKDGSDTETPTLGLYYNLRVGTCSGCHDVVSGVYGGGDDNGYFGNMMQRKSITLNRPDLENKTIYWAVQTIDTGLAKSNWSVEQVYNITQNAGQPCTENWSYGEWFSCSNGQQTRIASDSNGCGTFVNRSAVVQSCSTAPTGPGGGSNNNPSIPITPPKDEPKISENVTWHSDVIKPGVDTGIIINETGMAASQVWVKVRYVVTNVVFDIERLASKPLTVAKEPEGMVYQYLNITHANLSDANIESGKVLFNVEKSWISENGINESTVALTRHSNDGWQMLRTSLNGEDNSSVHYLAETPGFSIFAITGQALTPESVCVPGEWRCNDKSVEECNNGGIWLETEPCPYSCENGTCIGNPQEINFLQNYLWVLVPILAVIIAAVGAIFKLKKPPKIGN